MVMLAPTGNLMAQLDLTGLGNWRTVQSSFAVILNILQFLNNLVSFSFTILYKFEGLAGHLH